MQQLVRPTEFVCLDNLADVKSLIDIKPYIDAAICYSWFYARPEKLQQSANLFENELGIQDYIEKARQNPENFGPKDLIRDLDHNDLLGSYLRFWGDIEYRGYLLTLRYSQDYSNKHLRSKSTSIACDDRFDQFYKWLDQQELFSEYGRVFVVVNEPFNGSRPHVDVKNTNSDPDEFIWFRFNLKKQFWIEVDSQKKYASGYLSWFDTALLHGGDPIPYACYSIRVDGVFSPKVRDYLTNYSR